jgi:hypothetical protein
MSNYQAIAAVTAALQQMLLPPVKAAVTGANVDFKRPPAKDDGKGPFVNIYLYQVTPNAAFRNDDLPTRRSDGSLAHRPLTALVLHYLITFYGKEEQLEPQLMLGAVANQLQLQPALSPNNIQTGESTFGLKSGLADQIERVRFTPTALSLEEFSKLWSAFFQVEYSLSVVYQASVVLIEPTDQTPLEALPVQTRKLYVSTFAQPTITQVYGKAGIGQPVVPGDTLTIQGTDLLGDLATVTTTVQIGNVTVTPTPTSITQTRIVLTVPATVKAGVLGVQVIQQLQLGKPPQPHPGYDSNVAAIVLQPVVVPGAAPSAVTAAQVAVGITPMVQPGQRIALLLNQTSGNPPAAFVFTLQPLTVASGNLTFPITGVPAGVYFIRVKVDGAESPLTLNAGAASGPTVTIP